MCSAGDSNSEVDFWDDEECDDHLSESGNALPTDARGRGLLYFELVV